MDGYGGKEKMAAGTLRFFSNRMMRQTEVSFVLPNDMDPMMVKGNPHFKGP